MEKEIFSLLMQMYTNASLLAREHNKVATRLLCIDYKSNIWNSKEDELNRHVCRSAHKYLFWKLYILHMNHSISRNIELELAWDSFRILLLLLPLLGQVRSSICAFLFLQYVRGRSSFIHVS